MKLLLIDDVVAVKFVNTEIMSAWLLFNDNKFDAWVVVHELLNLLLVVDVVEEKYVNLHHIDRSHASHKVLKLLIEVDKLH